MDRDARHCLNSPYPHASSPFPTPHRLAYLPSPPGRHYGTASAPPRTAELLRLGPWFLQPQVGQLSTLLPQRVPGDLCHFTVQTAFALLHFQTQGPGKQLNLVASPCGSALSWPQVHPLATLGGGWLSLGSQYLKDLPASPRNPAIV